MPDTGVHPEVTLEDRETYITVNLATRSELAKERRQKHEAISGGIKAVVTAMTALFVALRFDLPPDVVAILPMVGIVLALVSMFMVRQHRKELRRIEWKGSNIEEEFKKMGIHQRATLFVRPDSEKLKLITIPVVVHLVLVGFWVMMYFIN